MNNAPTIGGTLLAAIVLVASPCVAEEANEAGRALIRQAQDRVEEADFEAALSALEQAAAGSGLAREDALSLVATRALVYYALGNERELEAELSRLAALAPEYSFDASVPPALQRQFTAVSSGADGPLGLEVEASEIRGGFRINASVENDPGGLVEQILIFSRVPGGEWVRAEGGRASIPVGEGVVVEYHVRVLGPGMATLCEEGTETEPRSIGTSSGDSSIDMQSVLDVDDGEDDERRVSPWVWIGASVGVLAVAAGVVTVVLLSRSARETQLDSPAVEWP